jgi:hypothetical protein
MIAVVHVVQAALVISFDNSELLHRLTRPLYDVGRDQGG